MTSDADAGTLAEIHHLAHEACFIANSVKTESASSRANQCAFIFRPFILLNGRAQLPLAWNHAAPDTELVMFDLDRTLRELGHQYERETRSIHVAVKPAYLDDQSDPETSRYVWSYTVTIENRGRGAVQLLSRYWNITDGAGPGAGSARPRRGRRAAGDRAGREIPVHQRLPAGDRLRR